MSWQVAESPECPEGSPGKGIELVITPQVRSLGSFDVRRALPARKKQMIGPFIFFDQMGPTVFAGDQAIDVRPHPHIGISTITWLFEGEIQHRDSLGFDVTIRPGEVNWMTAGSGIVHSERSPESSRGKKAPLAGIQSWVALPKDQEEIAPAFYHYSADQIPQISDKGVRISLIVGTAWGQTSAVKVASATLYAEINLQAGANLTIPNAAQERGIYLYAGKLDVNGMTFDSGNLLVLKEHAKVAVCALADTRFILLGGATLDGPRHLYWNFVSSSQERIEKAKQDWLNKRFPSVPGDDEFIPLPGHE